MQLRYVKASEEDKAGSTPCFICSLTRDHYKLQVYEPIAQLWDDVSITEVEKPEDRVFLVRDHNTGLIDSIWSTEDLAHARLVIAQEQSKTLRQKMLFVVLPWKLNSLDTPFTR